MNDSSTHRGDELTAAGQCAGHHIIMTRQVLCGRVNDEVCTQAECLQPVCATPESKGEQARLHHAVPSGVQTTPAPHMQDQARRCSELLEDDAAMPSGLWNNASSPAG